MFVNCHYYDETELLVLVNMGNTLGTLLSEIFKVEIEKNNKPQFRNI